MTMPRPPWDWLSMLACAAVAASCGPALPDPGAEAEKLRQASVEQLSGDAKHCTVQRQATEPDLFGWDTGSRAKLKATAEQGLVVVHFEQHGCDVALAVLNCTTTKTAYHYTPRHAQQTRFAENDADLYARFPVAAADLRGRLGANRAIRADYRMEGIDMIPIGTTIEPGDLRGSECDGATHVVRAIHRGAFAVAAASLSELRTTVTLFEASAKQKLGIFDGDGFQEACEGARTKGTRESGCDEPLRIELQPLQASSATREAPVTYAIAVAPPAAPEAHEVPAVAARSVGRRWSVTASTTRAAPPAPRVTAPWVPTPFKAATGGAACPAAMADIRGGTFTMGSDDTDAEEEGAPHRVVTLEPYCLDRTEVTVAAYARCDRCRRPAPGEHCNGPDMGKDDHPQNCVSWDDATTYCAWAGKQLPSEAQWELAARGGAQQRRWPWGSTPPTPERACWNRWSAGGRGTCRAGAFPETAFGLKDMAGNVWEWVEDWYGPFGPNEPSVTPSRGAGRVMRGGAWSSASPAHLGSASRGATWPTNRDDYLGFRCAWTP